MATPMATLRGSVSSADAQDGLTYLAKAGYAARGVVYLLIGGLAAMAAVGAGGETTGSRGALDNLTDSTAGQVLLFLVGVGLVGYAIWRLVQAHYDLDSYGRDGKGLVKRAAMVISAFTHIALATWVFTALFAGDSSGGDGQQRWVGWLIEQPGGPIWVGLIGLAVAAAGVAQIVKGWKANFEKYLDPEYVKLPWARFISRFGLIARGVVFVILGWFFLQAALTYEPGQAGGLGAVLQWLGEQAWGWLILGVVALGLVAFGVYSILEAIYRRINPPSELRATPA